MKTERTGLLNLQVSNCVETWMVASFAEDSPIAVFSGRVHSVAAVNFLICC